MKLLLLLALLLGAVSTRHLKVDTSSLQSLRGEESLAQDGETAEGATREATAGALMPLPEEEEMEGASGSEDDPEEEEEEEEEEEVEFSSELDVSPEDIQCPKEEDTVKFFSRPGYKTRGYVMVGSARTFNEAQWVCQRCYRGNLASIHSFAFNYQVQCTSAGLNVAQVWIGGQLRGKGRCRRFVWVDRTVWNFAYWARGQPWGGRQRGRCVTLCARGGHWRRSHCGKRRPFVCTY